MSTGLDRRLRGGQRLVAVIAAVAAIATSVAIAATPVQAAEGEPLGITNFTVETTAKTTLQHSGSGWEVTNEPYVPAYTQAGGHPWGLTTHIDLTSKTLLTPKGGTFVVPTRDVRDLVASLPPGLLGDPMAAPRCSLTQVTSSAEQCPAATQVGVYSVTEYGGNELLAPIVDVAPENGQSAEFALENTNKQVTPILTAHLVHTPAGYSFTVASNEIPTIGVTHAELTFWGVPADPSHDPMRGLFCHREGVDGELECSGGGQEGGVATTPFLTMSTDCAAGPEPMTLRADSWSEPGSVSEGRYTGYVEAQTELPGATGCNALRFDPRIEVRPDSLMADEPVGLGVNLVVPLSEKPDALATPQLRDTVVTLPEGMSVSPGIVDGIQACNEFGPEGINITGPESEEVGLSGELQLASGHCPNASTVGTAEAITPFLPIPIKGHVYLARPGCGGAGQPACTEADALDGNLYRLYLELGGTGELAATGIHFKVALQTQANPATGQLSTRTLGTPQAPFSELRIRLNGGPRAPIDNPADCGAALTTTDFTPWSSPGVTPQGLAVAGTPDATPSSFFDVQGCQNPPPFSPGFLAGNVTTQGGAFSPFTTNFSRNDREQFVKGIQVHTPPGLAGIIANVPLCDEVAANNGTCPEASRIGTTRVASGAGSHPFEISGNVYLTEHYRGAPFGLSIVTDAVAGPFNLGLVVVRATIAVDPSDGTLTVTTDESGPHAVPQIIFGVPLRLKRVTVNIDRSRFMFNPTNCSPLQITAKLSGTQGAVANVASPFAAGGCKSLGFKPKFTVSTQAHTSRKLGASLDAKVSYPKGALGTEANVKSVKVSLPRLLPSRLSTLQQACTAKQFAQDPGHCPVGSVVGIARASTPLLPVGLTGPAYFVSHGGEEFPSLIVVLQGDHVRVDLVGSTFISKAGITTSTFKTVPDLPVNTFELYLPEGRDSALAANGVLCRERSKLKMPTEFVAQNNSVLKQTTTIHVNGCPAKKSKRAQKTRGGKGK